MLEQAIPITDLVPQLNQQTLAGWWAFPPELPDLGKNYPPADQHTREIELDSFLDSLLTRLKSMPSNLEARHSFQEQLIAAGFEFAEKTLGMPPAHLDLIRRQGFLDANRQFARQARAFDPAIRADDIYQAGRNVMTMNFIQVLMGLPVEVTPAVFAYSMLYPYTDNYIDDPSVPAADRREFNQRFRSLLEGNRIEPANRHEAAICRLVGMITEQFDRARFPQVYDSLLAIHSAQARSLQLMKPGAAPYDLDVLGLTFEKGGTSVLADGYLVAGELAPSQAVFLYTYGAFTQLMDDLEDVTTDRRAGRMSIFSQTALRWPLDALTTRTFHLGTRLMGDLSMFPGPDTPILQEIIAQNIHPVLIDTIARARRFYTPAYLRTLERFMPFRYTALEKQRRKLKKHHAALSGLIEALI